MEKENILDLIKPTNARDDPSIVYFRSGPNHPWRKFRINLSEEEKKQEEKEAKKYIDLNNIERNLRWWNNYIPENYQVIIWADTNRDLRDIEEYIED